MRYLPSPEIVVIISMLILEEASLKSKLVDEMVSEAVVVRQAHRAKL